MNDFFTISVVYKKQPEDFEARLLQFAYSYKIEVLVHNTKLYFDRDDAHELRATIEPDANGKMNNKIDSGLVALIANEIEKILKD